MLKLIDMHVANEDVDSHVYCRFQQKLRPDVTNQRVYNLAEPYYLLVATGSADFRSKLEDQFKIKRQAKH